MVTGLIPPELVDLTRNEIARQWDCELDVYRQSGTPDGQGNKTYPTSPTFTVPARIAGKSRDEFYDAAGTRHVITGMYYLPFDTDIEPTDRLIGPNDDPTTPAPILAITQQPTQGVPLMLVVKTGAAT